MSREIEAIVNPASGAGRTRRRWPRIARELARRGLRVGVHLTTRAGEATGIARSLLLGGAREIVCVGGDGTANEVANGFFEKGGALVPDAVLAVIPTGTGHDFARNLGIRSVRHAIEGIVREGIIPIDVGFVDYVEHGDARRRAFLNSADVGMGAVAAARINRSSKALGGFATYALGAVRAIASYRAEPVRVTVDGTVLRDGPAKMVLIANGRFHGGGMRMAPMADAADGYLEVLVLEDLSRLALLGSLLPRAYLGRHLGHRGLRHARGREVEVRGARSLLFEVDGEPPGTLDLRAWVLPRVLRVRVPPDAGSPSVRTSER